MASTIAGTKKCCNKMKKDDYLSTAPPTVPAADEEVNTGGGGMTIAEMRAQTKAVDPGTHLNLISASRF